MRDLPLWADLLLGLAGALLALFGPLTLVVAELAALPLTS